MEMLKKTFFSSLMFRECFRVLKPDGTLIFKWNELSPDKKTFFSSLMFRRFWHKSAKVHANSLGGISDTAERK